MSGKPYRVDFHWWEMSESKIPLIGAGLKARFYAASTEHILKLVALYIRKGRITSEDWMEVRFGRFKGLKFEGPVSVFIEQNN